MCKCGGCKAPMNNCQMGPGCHGLQEQNKKLDAYLAKGMTREQILAAFVADHGGQDILAVPLDEGVQPARVGTAVCRRPDGCGRSRPRRVAVVTPPPGRTSGRGARCGHA